jgi:hypothetical protein
MAPWIWTFIENLAANWTAELFGPKTMIAWLITLAVVIYGAISWHRRQRAAKKQGMASWQFISLCLVISAVGIGGAAFGLGLRLAKPSGDSLVWMLPKAAAEKFVPPDKNPAESLRELLLSGVLVGRGVPHYGSAGDPAVQIAAAEWQSLTLAGRDFSSATSKQGPAHSYDNVELAAVGDFSPAFWNVAGPTPAAPQTLAVDQLQRVLNTNYSQPEANDLVPALNDLSKAYNSASKVVEDVQERLQYWSTPGGDTIFDNHVADVQAAVDQLIERRSKELQGLQNTLSALNDADNKKPPATDIAFLFAQVAGTRDVQEALSMYLGAIQSINHNRSFPTIFRGQNKLLMMQLQPYKQQIDARRSDISAALDHFRKYLR